MLCNVPSSAGKKRHRNERLWSSSAFARFLKAYGVGRLATRLGIDSSAVYHWASGAAVPHPRNAMMVVRLAIESGDRLTVEQIYQHSRDVRGQLRGGYVTYLEMKYRRKRPKSFPRPTGTSSTAHAAAK
jgi:hypothetical protein